jgi:hypothetical protein
VTFKQSQALAQMAGVLYSFLPGSGHASWKGHVSFSTVARDVGVGGFWQSGSKEPAIAMLLERTLDRQPERFEPLILGIVRHGMAYRQKQGRPIQREEIKTLNGLLIEVGFKFPDLWAQEFLDSLSGDPLARAQAAARSAAAVADVSAAEAARAAAVLELRTRFYGLAADPDRQAAGLALQDLLNDLFRLFDLEPRQAFRVEPGEQIDGSFLLDYETYLVEAKWTKEPVPESDLLVFKGKVEGKSAFTRGVFISLNNASDAARDAITRGKQVTFFLVDGYDLTAVLEGQIDLPTLLRLKLRKLTEEGRVFVSAKDLLTTAGIGPGEGAQHG